MSSVSENLRRAGAVAGGLDLANPAVITAVLHNTAALVSAASPEVWEDESAISAATDLVETLAPGVVLDPGHDIGPV